MFKDLLLNRDNIPQAIDLFCKANYSSYSVSESDVGLCKRYSISFDGNTMFLDVHYNNGGGTTLYVNNGKQQDEKKKLAQYIIDSPLCAMADASKQSRNMVFKSISKEDFDKLIDTISEEDDCQSVTNKEETDNSIIVKLDGRWSDKVTITYYSTSNTVVIQGRPLLLYSLCTSMFNELIDIGDVVDCLDNTYSLNLSGKTIEEQYVLLFPKSHDKHPSKLKKSLLRAVYNLNLDQQEYGCTELIFEPLRALEGHIKLTLLRDYSIKSPNKKGLLSFFSYDSAAHTVTISSEQEGIIAAPDKIQYYKDAYKYYVEYRHKMFHWDYPDKVEDDTTEQLDDIADAHRIIRDTLALIEKYY